MRLSSLTILIIAPLIFSYGQIVNRVFEMNHGAILSDEKLVLACTHCVDINNECIFFYENVQDQWFLSDSLSIKEFFPNYKLSNFKVSADGNTLGVYLVDPENPQLFGYNDALAVIKKRLGSWELVFIKEEILIGQYSKFAGTYQIDFSKSGDIFVISHVNINAPGWTSSNGITTEIYTYESGAYSLLKSFYTDIITEHWITLNLLDDESNILVGIDHNGNDEVTNQFLAYRLENDIWSKVSDVGNSVMGRRDPPYAVTDSFSNHIYVTSTFELESFDTAIKDPYFSRYRYDDLLNDWIEDDLEAYSSNKALRTGAIDVSDSGQFIAVGFVRSGFTDLSYVDFLKVGNNGYQLLTTLSFDDDAVGAIVDVSESGRWLMLNKGTDYIYLLDMDEIINDNQGSTDIYNIDLYPNPSTGIIHINTFNIDFLEVYDAAGQFIGRYSERTIDMSDYPSGIYIIKVFLESGRLGLAKVVKV